MDRRRLDHFLEPVRQGGGRLTTPRRVIATAFLDAGGHVTAEDLAETIHDEHPEIAVSTVYRTMEALEELGMVEHLHMGHGPAVYHLVDEGHHHLVCESCDTIIEVPDEVLAEFSAQMEARFGFRIETRHFALPGMCLSCLEAAG